MEVAFLLHLYQPPIQSEATFRKVAEESYIPLIRTIKNSRRFNLTLSIPLSLLELADRFGYTSWIADIRSLVDSGRVNLVGGAAYHPLLTKIPQTFVEKQIAFNEFGLGYYFGKHSGFEGEQAVLIKDVNGFFPPELAVNEGLIATLNDFGYEWVLVDETALPAEVACKPGVYNLAGCETKIVCRNRGFSNMLSFKRDLDTSDIVSFIKRQELNAGSLVVALDGEFFGHHFDSGLHLLGSMLGVFHDIGVDMVTMDEYMSSGSVSELPFLNEGCWGASDEDVLAGEKYPMWDASDNKIHKLQWELLDRLTSIYVPAGESALEGYETLPIWVPQELEKIKEVNVKDGIYLDLLINKALNSDQFWWASGKKLLTGEVLYSMEMIERGLSLFEKVADILDDTDYKQLVKTKSEEIRSLL